MQVNFSQQNYNRPSNKKYVEPEKKKPIKETAILFIGLACIGYGIKKHKPKY